MTEYLPIINAIGTILIIPGLLILSGIKVEIAKLTTLLTSHHDRISRLEIHHDKND